MFADVRARWKSYWDLPERETASVLSRLSRALDARSYIEIMENKVGSSLGDERKTKMSSAYVRDLKIGRSIVETRTFSEESGRKRKPESCEDSISVRRSDSMAKLNSRGDKGSLWRRSRPCAKGDDRNPLTFMQSVVWKKREDMQVTKDSVKPKRRKHA